MQDAVYPFFCRVSGSTISPVANTVTTASYSSYEAHHVVMFLILFSVCVCVFVFTCRQLSYVTERCEGEPEGDGVAALTSEERTRWAKVRVLMFGDFAVHLAK